MLAADRLFRARAFARRSTVAFWVLCGLFAVLAGMYGALYATDPEHRPLPGIVAGILCVVLCSAVVGALTVRLVAEIRAGQVELLAGQAQLLAGAAAMAGAADRRDALVFAALARLRDQIDDHDAGGEELTEHLDRQFVVLHGYLERRLTAIGNAQVNHAAQLEEVTGEIPSIATTADVAKVAEQLELSDRDRDLALAAMHDAIERAKREGKDELQVCMRWVVTRLQELNPNLPDAP